MKRGSTIRVAKTKALISFEVTAKLIYAFVFAYAMYAEFCFLMRRLTYFEVLMVSSIPVIAVSSSGENKTNMIFIK